MLDSVNIVTIVIACIFFIPILVGIVRPLTSERIHRSFISLLSNLILLASVVLSIYLTRLLLSGGDNFVLTNLYKIFPSLQSVVASQEIWVSIVFIVVLLIIIDGLLHLLTLPLRRYAVAPISKGISSAVRSMNGFFRRMIGGLWQLPKSIWLVLVFSLLLNFYTGLFNSPFITEAANNSVPYQLVQENAIQPLLNSSVVKDVKIILNDSFKLEENGVTDSTGKIQLVKYFNGVTLGDAIQSNSEIDAAAKDIVGSETDDARKAYMLYIWICQNIQYDTSKAAAIARNPSKVSSGAIVAYTTGTGVCFDYSCLYIAMCRAVQLKVRFLTGMGFTGTVWGDHAWNQVYDSNKENWINVDTTFGSSGINYFDRAHFGLDHKDAVIQGEW